MDRRALAGDDRIAEMNRGIDRQGYISAVGAQGGNRAANGLNDTHRRWWGCLLPLLGVLARRTRSSDDLNRIGTLDGRVPGRARFAVADRRGRRWHE